MRTRMLTSVFWMAFVACAVVLGLACLEAVDAQSNQVDICHVTGQGKVRLMSVNENAVPAHLGHGDFFPVAFFADADGDGFGNAGVSVEDYTAPAGFVDNSDDCDDREPAVNPDAEEILGDGVDNDCNPATPPAVILTTAAGGTGGSPYILDCPAGEAAVGIQGLLGPILQPSIGSVQVACESGALTGSAGALVGTPYTLSCPMGTVVTGVEGSTRGPIIENLSIQCTPPAGGTTTVVGPAGTGATIPFTLSCPLGATAMGVQGRAGQVLEQIQVRCQASQ